MYGFSIEASFCGSSDVRVAAAQRRVVCTVLFTYLINDCDFMSVHPATFGTARISLDQQKWTTYKVLTQPAGQLATLYKVPQLIFRSKAKMSSLFQFSFVITFAGFWFYCYPHQSVFVFKEQLVVLMMSCVFAMGTNVKPAITENENWISAEEVKVEV